MSPAGPRPPRRVTVLNRQRLLRLDRGQVVALAEMVLDMQGAAPGQGVALMFARDPVVRDYNRRYLRCDNPTDVISFPAGATPGGVIDGDSVGDVIISVDQARQYACAHEVATDEEAARYIVHGILHCLGYDDTTPAARRAMTRRQEELLRAYLQTGGRVLRAAPSNSRSRSR